MRLATYRSESPCHLLTKSLDDTLKNVPFASVATAFAKYDLPVPGGPYSKIPRHGVRFPVNRCGNLMGRMTASFNDSLAASRPATSSHRTFGLSATMALANPARSFFVSGSVPSSSSFLQVAQLTFSYDAIGRKRLQRERTSCHRPLHRRSSRSPQSLSVPASPPRRSCTPSGPLLATCTHRSCSESAS